MPPKSETATLLFVCTGNTCRSPLAEVLARQVLHGLGESVRVHSAGTAALEGSPASSQALSVAREAGLDLTSHRARSLTPEMLVDASLVLVMGEQHLAETRRLAPQAPAHLLAAYAGGEPREVPDPFGGDLEVYRATLARLRSLVQRSTQRFRCGLESERI
jgi:protein-tyrosine phosphatase